MGFGCGDQTLFWFDRYGVQRLTGYNSSAEQVAVAQRRITQALPPHTARHIDLRYVCAASRLHLQCSSSSLFGVCAADTAQWKL